MDEAFIKSDRPLPTDFDFAYWNGAHPDLQIPWLYGDETIDLINVPVHGIPVSRTDSQGNNINRLQLPELTICGLVTSPDGSMRICHFRLDTLLIHADEKLLMNYLHVMYILCMVL